MTKRIAEGSLVCTKRKIEGMGIVLKRVKNINEYAEFDLSGAFIEVYKPASMFDLSKVYTSIYNLRYEMIRKINAKIIEKKPEVELELLQKFWSHNREYSHQFRPKKTKKRLLEAKIDFCLVNWSKAPSSYHGVPAQRFRRQNVWMLSNSIRNKT